MTFRQFAIIAQANAEPPEATPGEILVGLGVLLILMASLAMIVAWVVRIGQIGHALPSAQRGVLRVPVPLTIVAIALSLLMFTLMLLLSDEDLPANQVAAPPVQADVETVDSPDGSGDSSGEPAISDQPKDAADAVATSDQTASDVSGSDVAKATSATGEIAAVDEPAAAPESPPIDPPAGSPVDAKEPDGGPKKSGISQMNPEQMKSAVAQTIVMDGVLLAVFGAFIFVASGSGRVRLPEAMSRTMAALSGGRMNSFQTGSSWSSGNDADLPESADSTMREGQLESSLMAPLVMRSASPYSVIQDPQGGPTIGISELAASTDEPFSFLTELWYAIEVFLAAYLPTAILRIIIVQLTMGLSGEDPGQHPFLEMLNAGVGIPVVIMILITAVFCAPVVEELQYRVIVLGGLAQFGRPMTALWLSSFLFAFAHGFPDSLALLPLAFALGYAYLRRRSYITVMLVHFLFNGFNMALALLAML